MIQPKQPPLISGTQFVAIVVLTISIFLIVDFGRRTTAGYHVSQAEKRLREEIDAALEDNARLKARRDYVSSDMYVEEWARREAHMVRPGDQPLIILTPPSQGAPADPVQPAIEAVAPVPVPNWYRWWLLFFGPQ